MELFLEHPRETLEVLRSSISVGFVPSLLFFAASIHIVWTTDRVDGSFLTDILFGYHVLRILLQFVAFPIRYCLYRRACKLLRIEVREQLVAGVLEMFASWEWKVYTALGEVMTMFIFIGILIASYCGWEEVNDAEVLNSRLHMAQTTFQVFYALVTMYRFGNVVLEGDGLQQLRSAQGVSKEELAQFTHLFKFKCLSESEKVTCQQSGCVVCYGQYTDDQDVRRLPCQHVYHAECIDTWLGSKSVCPSCQHDIKVPYTKRIPSTAGSANITADSNSNVHHHATSAPETTETPVVTAGVSEVTSNVVESRLARRNRTSPNLAVASDAQVMSVSELGMPHDLASPTSAQYLTAEDAAAVATGIRDSIDFIQA